MISEITRLKQRNAKLGKKLSYETRQKMSASAKGKKKPLRTEQHKINMSIAKTGKPHILTENGKKSFKEKMSGQNNPRYVKDRNKLVVSEKKHKDSKYKIWMLAVKNRDKWKCKLLNSDCKGRLESHHIFNWKEYPELRYLLTNGITLCAFHHPRGREEEKRTIPILQELLSVSKE